MQGWGVGTLSTLREERRDGAGRGGLCRSLSRRSAARPARARRSARCPAAARRGAAWRGVWRCCEAVGPGVSPIVAVCRHGEAHGGADRTGGTVHQRRPRPGARPARCAGPAGREGLCREGAGEGGGLRAGARGCVGVCVGGVVSDGARRWDCVGSRRRGCHGVWRVRDGSASGAWRLPWPEVPKQDGEVVGGATEAGDWDEERLKRLQ